MTDIFLDCFRHAYSYLNEGGGEPPDPGGPGGPGCDGADGCNDGGSDSCEEEFTLVRCVCLANGSLAGGSPAGPYADYGTCDEDFVCVQEGTNASELESNVENCDTGCDGWTEVPPEGSILCGESVVTPDPSLDCNVHCPSQNCTFYKCEESVDSETGVSESECVLSRSFQISAYRQCSEYLLPNEYPDDTCNDECPEPPPPPPDTDQCGPYYYCANFNNCNDSFNVTVAEGEPCPPTITTSVNGSDQTGYLNINLCRTAEYGCNNVYDGDPVPHLAVLWDEHFPPIFNTPPSYFCGTPSFTIESPGFGGLNIQDDGGETFNLEAMVFNPVGLDGSPRNDITFTINSEGTGILNFQAGPGGDINTGDFTFEVQGPGISNAIIQGYPNGPPSLYKKSCDNYPFQCATLELCNKGFNDIGPNLGGVSTNCNVYGCVWTQNEFNCIRSTKPKSFFGLSNNDSCPNPGSQFGAGFNSVIVGDSCPNNFCSDSANLVPVFFRRCVTSPGGVTTGECIQQSYDIPAHIANGLSDGSIYQRDGFTWTKGTCSPGICPNNQVPCDIYRCNGTQCVDQTVYVDTVNDCVGTVILAGENYTVGTCAAGGNQVCDPPDDDTEDILCNAFQCIGQSCTDAGQSIIPGVPVGTLCDDIKGQLVPGSTNLYVGTCADPGCGTDSEPCEVSYCDESQPPVCQHDNVPANQIFYNGDTLTSCDQVPPGTAVFFNGIPGIMGSDCPTQCNSSPLPPPPNSGLRDNIPERLRRYSDEQLELRARNYMASLQRLNNEEGIFDPVGSNRRYRDRTSFVPVRNRMRKDIFADYVHCTIHKLITKGYNNLSVPNAIFSNINLEALFRSLRRDIRFKLERVKDATGQPIKNSILNALRLAIINDNLSTFNLNNFPSVGFDVDEYKVTSSNDEKDLVKIINDKAKPLSPNFYQGYAKERMRLWKSLAPDLRKAVPLLLEDGTLEYSDISMVEEFNYSLSDGSLSTMSMSPGDIILYSQANGSTNALDIASDKERAFMLDREDYAKAFTRLGERLLTKIEVESPESALIEESYSLSSPRDDIYFLKLELSSIQDDDNTNPLIRTTKAKFTLMEDADDITEYIRYNPWPFETYYLRPEDPFFDHLEYSNELSGTFKDITFESLVGYRDTSIVMPRRMPWYITVVPTDDVSKLMSEGKTFLSNYNKRFFFARYTPVQKKGLAQWKPNFLSYEDQTARREGFDPRDNYVGTMSFSYNKDRFKESEHQYVTGKETLPRKETPVRKLLRTIKSVKDTSGSFVDENSEFIPWPEIYRNMTVPEVQALKFFQFDSWDKKENLITRNSLATEETVRERYSKISYTPPEKINNYDDYKKPTVVTRAQRITDDFEEETPEPLP